MTTIAFDTSTTATVAAVSHAGKVFETRLDAPNGGHPAHSRQLLDSLEALLGQAGAAWRDVERVGVGTGPGTFTGLRIASATAEGLRRSIGAEIVPVSSLEALAWPALGSEEATAVCAVIDARRGEVFASGWSGEGKPLFGPVAAGPDDLVAMLDQAGQPWLLAGVLPGGFDAIEEMGVVRGPVFEFITGEALCALAERGESLSGPALPEYVREPDAVKSGG